MANDLQKFEPANLGELKDFVKDIASSQLVPKDMRGKPADILLAIQLGKELGLSTVQSLQSIAIINGKPAVWGDAALGLVLGSGLCEDIVETVEDGVATCRVKRKGMESAQTRTFSIDDAKKAKLWGRQGPWTAYADRMLAMRARGFALRDCFADVLRGVITGEEAQDYPAEKPGNLPPRPAVQVTATATSKPEPRPAPVDVDAVAEANVTAAGFPPPREIAEKPEAEVVVEPVAPAGVVTAAQIKKVQTHIRANGCTYEELKPLIAVAYEIDSLKQLPGHKVDDLLNRISKFSESKKGK